MDYVETNCAGTKEVSVYYCGIFMKSHIPVRFLFETCSNFNFKYSSLSYYHYYFVSKYCVQFSIKCSWFTGHLISLYQPHRLYVVKWNGNSHPIDMSGCVLGMSLSQSVSKYSPQIWLVQLGKPV